MDGSHRPSRIPPEAPRANGRHDPDQIRQAMKALRQEIHRDAQATSEDAHRLVDWKSHVQSHPLLSVGVAAAAGFLLAPSSKRVVHLSDQQVDSLARRGEFDVNKIAASAAAPQTAGVVSSLLMTLGSMAGRTLLSHAVEQIESALRARHASNQQPTTDSHDPPPPTKPGYY